MKNTKLTHLIIIFVLGSAIFCLLSAKSFAAKPVTLQLANDELVIVQSVSTTLKTFVIRRGTDDGVALGQESLFSTTDISLRMKCIEISRYHSLWKLVEQRASIPFLKNEFITYTNNLDRITMEVSNLVEKEKEYSRIILKNNFWLFRTALSVTFFESISSTGANSDSSRGGIQFEIYRPREIYPAIEWAWGLRYDMESVILKDSNLEIPSTRILGMMEFTYNFPAFKRSNDNIYASLGAGFGSSSTNVNGEDSFGYAIVTPVVRIGYNKAYSSNLVFIVEGTGEAISTTETFVDGTEQTTNLVNVKLTVGVKF
ncbi:MAG: hypothetical protein HN576_04560 [Bacteriovoracaceae bacterium]|nr:hypothetical protein [Bacteriovoracaceae bacterium]